MSWIWNLYLSVTSLLCDLDLDLFGDCWQQLSTRYDSFTAEFLSNCRSMYSYSVFTFSCLNHPFTLPGFFSWKTLNDVTSYAIYLDEAREIQNQQSSNVTILYFWGNYKFESANFDFIVIRFNEYDLPYVESKLKSFWSQHILIWLSWSHTNKKG